MGRRGGSRAIRGPNGNQIHMLVDQFGNQPGRVLVRQPVIQRWRQRSLTRVQHAEVLPATRLPPPEVRARALSESYFGQSTTELIGHP